MKARLRRMGLAVAVLICTAALWGCGDAPEEAQVLETVGGIEYSLPGNWNSSSTTVDGEEQSLSKSYGYGSEKTVRGINILVWDKEAIGVEDLDALEEGLREMFQAETDGQGETSMDVQVAGLDGRRTDWVLKELAEADGKTVQPVAKTLMLGDEELVYVFMTTASEEGEKLASDLLDSVEKSIRVSEQPQPLQVEYGTEVYGEIAFDPGEWYHKRQSSEGNAYTTLDTLGELHVRAVPWTEGKEEEAVEDMLEELFAKTKTAGYRTTVEGTSFTEQGASAAGSLASQGKPVEAKRAAYFVHTATEFYGELAENLASKDNEVCVYTAYFPWDGKLYLFCQWPYGDGEPTEQFERTLLSISEAL